jgi:hypothetical protein
VSIRILSRFGNLFSPFAERSAGDLAVISITYVSRTSLVTLLRPVGACDSATTCRLETFLAFVSLGAELTRSPNLTTDSSYRVTFLERNNHAIKAYCGGGNLSTLHGGEGVSRTLRLALSLRKLTAKTYKLRVRRTRANYTSCTN